MTSGDNGFGFGACANVLLNEDLQQFVSQVLYIDDGRASAGPLEDCFAHRQRLGVGDALFYFPSKTGMPASAAMIAVLAKIVEPILRETTNPHLRVGLRFRASLSWRTVRSDSRRDAPAQSAGQPPGRRQRCSTKSSRLGAARAINREIQVRGDSQGIGGPCSQRHCDNLKNCAPQVAHLCVPKSPGRPRT